MGIHHLDRRQMDRQILLLLFVVLRKSCRGSMRTKLKDGYLWYFVRLDELRFRVGFQIRLLCSFLVADLSPTLSIFGKIKSRTNQTRSNHPELALDLCPHAVLSVSPNGISNPRCRSLTASGTERLLSQIARICIHQAAEYVPLPSAILMVPD